MDKKDLEEKCILAVKAVFDYFSEIKYSPTKDVIEKQLIRSVSSIGANFIEGSGSVSRREWYHYINIARKSALESEYWVKVLKELKLRKEGIEELQTEISELAKIFTSISKSSKKNEK